jgi:hypothetical protein
MGKVKRTRGSLQVNGEKTELEKFKTVLQLITRRFDFLDCRIRTAG